MDAENITNQGATRCPPITGKRWSNFAVTYIREQHKDILPAMHCSLMRYRLLFKKDQGLQQPIKSRSNLQNSGLEYDWHLLEEDSIHFRYIRSVGSYNWTKKLGSCKAPLERRSDTFLTCKSEEGRASSAAELLRRLTYSHKPPIAEQPDRWNP